jgi:uncharacterized membrane protein YphA (DoxX/SURF4 family)
MEYILLLERVVVGTFFVISGFHKLFNPQRHATLVTTLRDDHIPYVPVMCWFVPSIEFLAGLGVVFGFLTPLSALGLACIMLVAISTDLIPHRIPSWMPIDWADWLDDFLYSPETLYLIMLFFPIWLGGGRFSIDHYILPASAGYFFGQ